MWGGAARLSAGSIAYGAAQWLALVALAYFGGAGEVGRLAYALAITAPIFLMANFGLRNLLASDAERAIRYRSYVVHRAFAVCAALAVAIATGALAGGRGLFAVIVLVSLAKGVEGVADICHGRLHLGLRVDAVASSYLLRSAALIAMLAAVVAMDATAEMLAAALLGASLAVLVFCDARRTLRLYPGATLLRGLRGTWSHLRESAAAARQLTVRALPLALAALLTSLQLNIIRYVIAGELGMEPLGIFATMAYIGVIGGRVVHAAGTVATPRLGIARMAGDSSEMQGLLVRLMGFALLCGLLLLAAIALMGDAFLGIVQRGSVREMPGVFLVVGVACALEFLAVALQYVLTACRGLRSQLVGVASGSLVLLLAAPALTRSYGLIGAAFALALSWAVIAAVLFAALLYSARELYAERHLAGAS